MQRFRSQGTSLLDLLAVPHLKKRALNSWSAIQDSYFSTKDLFERHRVVFTIGTSVASVATAWGGYCLRHLHDSKVDQRLESIEKAMKNNHHIEHAELKNIVDPGSSSMAKCVATAGTTFVIGYGLGWRGGGWYANRKFRKEQMKMLGQMKPKRWQLLGRVRPKEWQFQFINRSFSRHKAPENGVKACDKILNSAPTTGEIHQSS